MKFCLPTLKHLVIQLAKLQIYSLNLTTTFWHCKKKSHYFWTGVYLSWVYISPIMSLETAMLDVWIVASSWNLTDAWSEVLCDRTTLKQLLKVSTLWAKSQPRRHIAYWIHVLGCEHHYWWRFPRAHEFISMIGVTYNCVCIISSKLYTT